LCHGYGTKTKEDNDYLPHIVRLEQLYAPHPAAAAQDLHIFVLMSVSFALVHHANQYLITNGYDNREGISDIVGADTSQNGILGILALHCESQTPLNLHISGTLLSAIAWHCPEAISDCANTSPAA
jgi:hypothetical protein